MFVVGIETTCDETGIAIVKNGNDILSNVVGSQAAMHALYGGVVPEEASRQHMEIIGKIFQESLDEAEIPIHSINLVAVAEGPGLAGALLVGIHFAKGLSLGLDVPIVGVNHVEAHLYSTWMSDCKEIPLPAIGVVLSGGHTALLKVNAIHDYELIGQTRDDACGEAFDKVARLLDLPYPGGPQIEKLAQEGNPFRFPLKPGVVKNRPFDFSFSGLKTAVLYLLKGQNCTKNSPLKIPESDKKDLAASFQYVAFNDIVSKTRKAADLYQAKSILIGGGVSQNQMLKSNFENTFKDLPIFWPPNGLSLDNGAMIAGLGYEIYKKCGPSNPETLLPKPRIPF